MSYLINQSVPYMELDRRWHMPVFAEETISLLFKAGGRQLEDTHITYLQAKDIAFDILRVLSTQCTLSVVVICSQISIFKPLKTTIRIAVQLICCCDLLSN